MTFCLCLANLSLVRRRKFRQHAGTYGRILVDSRSKSIQPITLHPVHPTYIDR
jgi:hypothetical protein